MVSALMATHNGARTLPLVLDAYCKLDAPSGGWKIIVVDNGSTDATKQIVTSYQSRLPLTYAWEPRLGKSVALNTGLASVEGDLIAMTDDDAVPERSWLAELRNAADAQPEYSVFGGAIVPQWEAPPPKWILQFWDVLTLTRPEWEEGPTVMARVSGPNMCVRADVIRAGFRFDESMGPAGSKYRMGEDIDFVQRLGKAGYKAWHCKRAVVAHIIRKSQFDRNWMLGKAGKLGTYHYQWECLEYSDKPPALLFGMPRYVIREIFEQWFRVQRARLGGDSEKVYQERWQLNYLIGRAKGGRVLFGKMRSD